MLKADVYRVANLVLSEDFRELEDTFTSGWEVPSSDYGGPHVEDNAAFHTFF
jgi:hypothetical protein